MTGGGHLNAQVVGGSGFAMAWLLICRLLLPSVCTAASDGGLGRVTLISDICVPKHWPVTGGWGRTRRGFNPTAGGSSGFH